MRIKKLPHVTAEDGCTRSKTTSARSRSARCDLLYYGQDSAHLWGSKSATLTEDGKVVSGLEQGLSEVNVLNWKII